MPKPGKLLIKCDEYTERGDHLEANCTDATIGRMYLRVSEYEDQASIILNKDTARELFNWLGVYLHG